MHRNGVVFTGGKALLRFTSSRDFGKRFYILLAIPPIGSLSVVFLFLFLFFFFPLPYFGHICTGHVIWALEVSGKLFLNDVRLHG